ncbi:MAG: hypothetical protein H7Z75_20400, partial [Ferruginibacter sp.]|nr:hypothetical protein [Cytophagales bacterium]
MKKKIAYLFTWTWGVAALLAGCGKSGDELAGRTQRALDSLTTSRYFADPDVRQELRGELAAFYQNRQYRLAWVSGEKPLAQAEDLLKSIDRAYQEGFQPDDYNAKEIRSLQQKVFGANARDNNRLADLIELDFRMTANYLTYASHLFSGRTNPTRLNKDWLSKPRKKDLSAYLEAAIGNNQVGQSLADLLPRSAQYTNLRQQLMHYAAIGA